MKVERGRGQFRTLLARAGEVFLSSAMDWRDDRELAYVKGDGWKQREGFLQSWLDCRDRYMDGGVLRSVPESVDRVVVKSDDSRLTVSEARRRERREIEFDRERRDRAREVVAPDWPFSISRDEASVELESGEGRSSSYGERLEWVAQNLDKRSVRPSDAPCNGSWSMLVWAVENRKDFYSQQRQFVARGEQEGEEQKVLDRDFGRFEKMIERFSCWRRLDTRVEELGVYRENE